MQNRKGNLVYELSWLWIELKEFQELSFIFKTFSILFGSANANCEEIYGNVQVFMIDHQQNTNEF